MFGSVPVLDYYSTGMCNGAGTGTSYLEQELLAKLEHHSFHFYSGTGGTGTYLL
jgi:hypothetical protein